MNKASGVFGKILIWFVVVLLVLGVAGIALFFVIREQGKVFYIECGDNRYFGNSSSECLCLLPNGEYRFSVKSLIGGEVDFDVKIMSSADNNIAFAYNNEFHHLYTGNNEIDDYSVVFGLQTDKDGFTVIIPQDMTVEKAIEMKFSDDVVLLDSVTEKVCYFDIVITVGKSSTNIGFNFDSLRITLDPPQIIF